MQGAAHGAICATATNGSSIYYVIRPDCSQPILASGSGYSWSDARTEAMALGGDLVTLNDATEEAFIAGAFASFLRLWIGLNDISAEGAHVWADGDPSTYRNWLAGEPNDVGGGEDCVESNISINGWNDVPCSLTIFAALVEVTSHTCALSETTAAFGFTGALQTFTVPAGVTSANIFATGADGGDAFTNAFLGGTGATVSGTFTVTPSETLQVLVGGAGADGTGLGSAITPPNGGGGGGGGSFVATGSGFSSFNSTDLLLAAGGGGGASHNPNFLGANANGLGGSAPPPPGFSGGSATLLGGCGGAGRDMDGASGTVCTGGSTPSSGGAGGTSSSMGGAGGFGGGGAGGTQGGLSGGGGGGGAQGGDSGNSHPLGPLPAGTPAEGGFSFNGGTSPSGSNGVDGGATGSHGLVTICYAAGASLDFGDAPDDATDSIPGAYPTLLANNGARHTIGTLFLGPGPASTSIDSETDGQQNTTATGDDTDGNDDENGVALTNAIVSGAFTIVAAETASLVVTASGAGLLDAWIDFNRDGDWTDSGEQIFASEAVTGGVNAAKTFLVPATAVRGTSFARFRLSSAGGLLPTGAAADGEVEDYAVEIHTYDYGDAPDVSGAYPTLRANNGARHTLDDTLYLGPGPVTTSIDDDTDGQQNPTASGDDADGNDDEDGVVFTTTTVAGELVAGETATLTVTASAAGFLDAWVDFNRDGDWTDVGEKVFSSEAVVGGANSKSFAVPATATGGTSFARFRLSSTGALSPTGAAAGGEVEDYEVEIHTWDYGDAPDPFVAAGKYPTLEANSGAKHTLGSLFLGSAVDDEANGQPNATATGDDTDTDGDDEDGITLTNAVVAGALTVVAGETATVGYTASASGQLDAWVDFNQDGDWTDTGEQIASSLAVTGASSFTFTVPADASGGTTFARFRISPTGGTALTPSGRPDDGDTVGEVEDYEVTVITWDYGDAPESAPPSFAAYPTKKPTGARHTVGTLFLGASVDGEPDGQPNATASDDDTTGSPDDEDGVLVVNGTPVALDSGFVIAGEDADIQVTASTTGGELDAWVDFNQDGTWDAGEQVFTGASTTLSAGSNTLSFAVPQDAKQGTTFARFRISPAGGTALGPSGTPPDGQTEGEVEDYSVEVRRRGDLSVSKDDGVTYDRASYIGTGDDFGSGTPEAVEKTKYTIMVSNSGPSLAEDVPVMDDFAATGLLDLQVTAITLSGGATSELNTTIAGSFPACLDGSAPPSTGCTITSLKRNATNDDDLVDLPGDPSGGAPDSTVIYTIEGTWPATGTGGFFTGDKTNTASVTPPTDFENDGFGSSGNNSNSDTTTINDLPICTDHMLSAEVYEFTTGTPLTPTGFPTGTMVSSFGPVNYDVASPTPLAVNMLAGQRLVVSFKVSDDGLTGVGASGYGGTRTIEVDFGLPAGLDSTLGSFTAGYPEPGTNAPCRVGSPGCGLVGDGPPDTGANTITVSDISGSMDWSTTVEAVWIPERSLAGTVAAPATYKFSIDSLTDNAPTAPQNVVGVTLANLAVPPGTAECRITTFDVTVYGDADLDGAPDEDLSAVTGVFPAQDDCAFNRDIQMDGTGFCGCPTSDTLSANTWYLRSMACKGADDLGLNYDEIVNLPLPYASLDVDPGGASEDTWWAFERSYSPLPGSYDLIGEEDKPTPALLPLGRSHWIYLDDRFFAPIGEGPSTTIDPVTVKDDATPLTDTLNPMGPGTPFPGGKPVGDMDALEVALASTFNTMESVPNMVGHPFQWDLCWRDVRFVKGGTAYTLEEVSTPGFMTLPKGAVDDTFHKWNGSTYVAYSSVPGPTAGTLNAADGFWIHVYEPGWKIRYEPIPAPDPTAFPSCDAAGISLRFAPDPSSLVTSAQEPSSFQDPAQIRPLRAGPVGPAERPEAAVRDQGFFIRLIASSSSGLRDPGNVLGQLPDSSRGLDKRDLWELPADVEPNLSLYFPSIGGEEDQRIYGSDFHPISYEQDEWLFVVSTSETEDTVTLTWETEDELRLYRSELVDVLTEEVIAVTPGGSYSFPATGGQRAFVWRLRP